MDIALFSMEQFLVMWSKDCPTAKNVIFTTEKCNIRQQNKDRTCWAAVHGDHYVTGTVTGTSLST